MGTGNGAYLGNAPTRSSNELCTGVRPTLEDETGPRLFRPTQARGSRLMTGQFLYRRRSVVIAGLAALLLAPERSAAQQPQSKIPRVGILTVADSDRALMFDAFR